MPTTSTTSSADTVTITLTSQFKYVFGGVILLTILAMVLSCSMIFSGVELTPGSEQAGLLQALITTWKLGFGAMIGLMGGKAM
jgi:hypothetical protein